MSSGHRTVVVVHSPPLSARAIKAVCDCTLGAVNVKAAAGGKKKKKTGKKEETLRSGQVRKGGTQPPLRTESPGRSYSRKIQNHFGGLWTPGGRGREGWVGGPLNDKWQNNSSPSDTRRERHGQPGV